MRRMRFVVVALLALAAWVSLAASPAGAAEPPGPLPDIAESGAALTLEREIPLAGVAGRIDHMAFDPVRQRLLVAELGNGSLDAVDLSTASVAHRITGLSEPQGVAFAPAADMVLVANGGDGTVRMFRAADYAPEGTIALGNDADDAALDPAGGRVVVGFGEGGLAIIDPIRRELVARIALPAHPEAFRLDRAADRAFVNLPQARQIAVVDLHNGQHLASWRTDGLRQNFPMALDQDKNVLAVAFRDPARLVLFDAADGRLIVQRPACDDADDVYFDARRQRIYLSCGAGVIDVFSYGGGTLDRIARITTMPGARTSLFVPELDRLFVAAPAPLLGDVPATILAFRPAP